MGVCVSSACEQKQGGRSADTSGKSKRCAGVQKNRIGSAASEVAKGGPSQDSMKVWILLENGEVLQLSWMTAWMT